MAIPKSPGGGLPKGPMGSSGSSRAPRGGVPPRVPGSAREPVNLPVDDDEDDELPFLPSTDGGKSSNASSRPQRPLEEVEYSWDDNVEEDESEYESAPPVRSSSASRVVRQEGSRPVRSSRPTASRGSRNYEDDYSSGVSSVSDRSSRGEDDEHGALYSGSRRSVPATVDDFDDNLDDLMSADFDEFEDDNAIDAPVSSSPRNTSDHNVPASSAPEYEDDALTKDELDFEDYEDDEDEEVEQPKKRGLMGRKSRKSNTSSDPRNIVANKSDPPTNGEVDDEGHINFVDKKKKKIKPFGASKKKNVNDKAVDTRKDRAKSANIVKYLTLALIFAMLASLIYNTVFPKKTFSEQDIAAISQRANGATGFPMQEGAAFAKDFVSAFLTTDNQTADAVLSYFYQGQLDGSSGGNSFARQATSDYKQRIVFGPTVYSESSLSESSGSYVVGALVQAEPPAPADPNVVNVDVQGAEPRWVFLNVNLYYDKAKGSMTVTPDSPAVVPNSEVAGVSELPATEPLGDGTPNPEIGQEIQPVVYGFLSAFATSSPSDYSAMQQYTVENGDPDLYRGLDGKYAFASGSVENSVSYETYGSLNGPNELKVLAKVQWSTSFSKDSQKIDGAPSMDYTSQYVITLQKEGSKWLVSTFKPYYYVEKFDPNAAETTK